MATTPSAESLPCLALLHPLYFASTEATPDEVDALAHPWRAALMPRRKFQIGDRVCVLRSLPDGWVGTATVSHDQYPNDPVVDFNKDNPDAGENPVGFAHWRELKLIEDGSCQELASVPPR